MKRSEAKRVGGQPVQLQRREAECDLQSGVVSECQLQFGLLPCTQEKATI